MELDDLSVAFFVIRSNNWKFIQVSREKKVWATTTNNEVKEMKCLGLKMDQFILIETAPNGIQEQKPRFSPFHLPEHALFPRICQNVSKNRQHFRKGNLHKLYNRLFDSSSEILSNISHSFVVSICFCDSGSIKGVSDSNSQCESWSIVPRGVDHHFQPAH